MSSLLSGSTDWNRYYSASIGFASITRWLSSHKILRLLRRNCDSTYPLAICELGGANSCFIQILCQGLLVERYHVIDSCSHGLQLLHKKRPQAHVQLSWEMGDVLLPQPSAAMPFDLVFSVGLIEHFDKAGTRHAIAAHFAKVRPGGLVLITFPTPTLVYRCLRALAERLGQWKFPDERPLQQVEVRECCRAHGQVLHESLNYGAIFTQAYVLVRAKGLQTA